MAPVTPPDPELDKPALAGDDLVVDGEVPPPGPSLDELYPPEADEPLAPER